MEALSYDTSDRVYLGSVARDENGDWVALMHNDIVLRHCPCCDQLMATKVAAKHVVSSTIAVLLIRALDNNTDVVGNA